MTSDQFSHSQQPAQLVPRPPQPITYTKILELPWEHLSFPKACGCSVTYHHVPGIEGAVGISHERCRDHGQLSVNQTLSLQPAGPRGPEEHCYCANHGSEFTDGVLCEAARTQIAVDVREFVDQ